MSNENSLLYPSINVPDYDIIDNKNNKKLEKEKKDNEILSNVLNEYRKQYSNDPNIEEKLQYIKNERNNGEVCTIEVAKRYDKYDDITILDNKLVENTENINIISDDHVLKQKPLSVCNYDMRNDIGSENCALGSPFLTSAGDVCKVTNGACPEGFKFKEGECVFNDLVQFQKDRVAFCENKWYDWFRVPNYHLNNGFQKYRSKNAEHKNDVKKCYKPCGYKEVPVEQDRTNYDSSNIGKCIPKNRLDYGMYRGIDYCPIALVHLLGMNNEMLYRQYVSEVNSNFKEGDKKRDEVYNEQMNQDSSMLSNANREIVNQARDYVENGNVSIKDIVNPKKLESRKCMSMVKKENVEDAYNICLDLMENRDEVKNRIKKQYKYDNKKKLNKHMNMLNNACKVSFVVEEPSSVFDTNKSDYAKMNWKVLHDEFSDKDYKKLSFDKQLDNNVNDENTNKEDRKKDAKNAKMLYGFNDILKFRFFSDDSYFSRILPWITYVIVIFCIFIIGVIIYIYGYRAVMYIWHTFSHTVSTIGSGLGSGLTAVGIIPGKRYNNESI